jgi:hypothetical protein
MSIREQLIFDNHRFHGGIDLGTTHTLDQDNDNISTAKNALVFMAVSLNGSWKAPLGYFLIRSLLGSERANLLTTLFQLLDEVNVKSYSITFDGAPTNLNMCTSLGANFNYFSESFKPFFVNSITKENCFVFFDLCHMIKLVRNTFGD